MSDSEPITETDILLKRYTASLRRYMSRLKRRTNYTRRNNIQTVIDKLKIEIEALLKKKIESSVPSK